MIAPQAKCNGLVSAQLLRRLGTAFSLLIGFEVLIGSLLMMRIETINEGLGDLVSQGAVNGMKPLAETVSDHTSFAIMALFGLIIFGSIVGGYLFWYLSQYIRLSGLLTDYISDGIAVAGPGWKIQSVNSPFALITGFSEEQLIGQALCDMMPCCTNENFHKTSNTLQCEYTGTRPDGSEFVASVSVFILKSRMGKPRKSLVMIKDVTSIRRSEENMRRLAYFDDLTGLANRPQLLDRLDTVIDAARRYRRKFALLYVDLDGFKDVNDSLGHDAGDELLKVTAERFRGALRSSDFVARLGGDEFCVILENIDSKTLASRVADRLLEVIGEPLVIAERRLKPRASIGIAIFPAHGQSRDLLLQVADTAMYAAKRAGKNQIAYYTPELTRLADLRLSLEHDLRHAIEENEFKLVYQPQVSLSSGHMIGVEALIRWEHPQRGLIMPDRFIPIAERIGMIADLGEWVLRESCRQAMEWQNQGVVLNMAVNISGSHFQNASLYNTVKEVLAETEMSPGLLELEVTEGVMQVEGDSVENFHRLKTLGINIAIDDFGTGYSSLASLKKLPVDHLKVDRAFLKDVLKDNKQAVIIATIIGMARALNLKVIVEGVETREHLSFLQGLGCNTVQGYFFSKPVLPANIPALFYNGFSQSTDDRSAAIKQSG